MAPNIYRLLLAVALVFIISVDSDAQNSVPVSKPSDVQYQVYLKNVSQTSTTVREQIIKALPSQELQYLRKEVRELGVIVKVNLSGKVESAEVQYFEPIKISENSKKAIGNTIKRNFSFDLSPQAVHYFKGIEKPILTFYYTIPVQYY